MAENYRTGNSLGTTLFHGPRTEGQQPVGIVFNLPLAEARALAERIVCLLNRKPHARDSAGARYENLLAAQAQALEAQARTITELQQERAALCRALYRESSDNQTLRADDVALVEQAEALQQANVRFSERLAANAEENARLAEENAALRTGMPFPLNAVIAENASLKRALQEKKMVEAVTEAEAESSTANGN
jgi:hypothetical protein